MTATRTGIIIQLMIVEPLTVAATATFAPWVAQAMLSSVAGMAFFDWLEPVNMEGKVQTLGSEMEKFFRERGIELPRGKEGV